MTEKIEFVVFDIFEHGVRSHFVEHMSLDFFAKALFELCHINVTGTESGNLFFLSDFFELFLYSCAVIVLYEVDNNDAFKFACFFECYFH